MAKYLGKELSNDEVKSIVEFCSFDNMRKSSAFELKAKPHEFARSVMGVECVKDLSDKQTDSQMKEMILFRKGQVGDWKNYLSDEMSRRLDRVIAERLTYSSKSFKYE